MPFITPSGHYEYRVMLYILSNSPSIFQGFMNEVWMGSRWTRGRSKPSQPQSVKEHQWFLGFANFYRRFIQNFILFSAPSLPCSGRNPSLCPGTPKLKQPTRSSRRPSALLPSFHIRNPQLPFIVEVDTSTTGVGAVLPDCTLVRTSPGSFPQWSRTTILEIGSCSALNWRRRHWLEGARHHFTVITDRKDQEYLWSAKMLNPRQARWALFFTQFQTSITYRPGECQGGFPLTYSFPWRTHTPSSRPCEPYPVGQDEPIRITEPAPLGGPEGKTYVPTSLRTTLHASPGSGHPGSQRTLSLCTGGPVWFRISPSTFVGAQTKPFPKLHITYPPDN